MPDKIKTDFFSKAVKVVSQAARSKDLTEVTDLQQRATKFIAHFNDETTIDASKLSTRSAHETMFSDTMSIRRHVMIKFCDKRDPFNPISASPPPPKAPSVPFASLSTDH